MQSISKWFLVKSKCHVNIIYNDLCLTNTLSSWFTGPVVHSGFSVHAAKPIVSSKSFNPSSKTTVTKKCLEPQLAIKVLSTKG